MIQGRGGCGVTTCGCPKTVVTKNPIKEEFLASKTHVQTVELI